MNVRLDAAFRYLDVRYSERERPYTDYPKQLTSYLTEQHLRGYGGAKLLDLGCGRCGRLGRGGCERDDD